MRHELNPLLGSARYRLADGFEDILARADIDLGVVAVDNQHVAMLDPVENILDAADHGNVEGAGHDGDMAGR